MKGMTEETTGAGDGGASASQVSSHPIDKDPSLGTPVNARPGVPAPVVPPAAESQSQGPQQGPVARTSVTMPSPTPTYEGDFVLDEHLLLECGRTLPGVTLHYAVYGRLNAARD